MSDTPTALRKKLEEFKEALREALERAERVEAVLSDGTEYGETAEIRAWCRRALDEAKP